MTPVFQRSNDWNSLVPDSSELLSHLCDGFAGVLFEKKKTFTDFRRSNRNFQRFIASPLHLEVLMSEMKEGRSLERGTKLGTSDALNSAVFTDLIRIFEVFFCFFCLRPAASWAAVGVAWVRRPPTRCDENPSFPSPVCSWNNNNSNNNNKNNYNAAMTSPADPPSEKKTIRIKKKTGNFSPGPRDVGQSKRWKK